MAGIDTSHQLALSLFLAGRNVMIGYVNQPGLMTPVVAAEKILGKPDGAIRRKELLCRNSSVSPPRKALNERSAVKYTYFQFDIGAARI